MNLTTGLEVGLRKGLLVGLNASAAQAAFTFDFSKPVAQARPTTAIGLQALFNNAQPSHIWAGTTTDIVGSADLDSTAGTPLLTQTGTGLWNGANFVGHPAIELAATGDQVATSSLRPALNTTDKLAVLCTFRAHTPAPSLLPFVGAWDATTDGFGILLQGTGVIKTRLGDGSTFVTSVGVIGPFTDGAWHTVLLIIDRTTDTMDVYTDLGNELGIDTSSVTGDATVTTGTFRLGRTAAVYSNALLGQCAYVALWEGAEVDKLTGLGSYWTHGSDPTGLLATATHASPAAFTVGADSSGDELVTHYTGGHGHGVDHLPLRLMPDGTGLGVASWTTLTNLIDYSEDFLGNWTESAGADLIEAETDSPDGFRRGTRLQGSFGATDNMEKTVTLSTSTQYTFSIWLKLVDGSSATIRFRYRNSTDPVFTNDWSVTDKWVRYSTTFTSHASDTTANLRVMAGNGASVQEDIYVWGAQLVASSIAGPYVRTQGATATSAGPALKAGTIVPANQGTIKATWSVDGIISSITQAIVDTVTLQDRKLLFIANATDDCKVTFLATDGSFITIGQPNAEALPSANTKYQSNIRWSVNADIGGSSLELNHDGEIVRTGAAYTAAGTRQLSIGAIQTGNSSPLEGAISKIEIFDTLVEP